MGAGPIPMSRKRPEVRPEVAFKELENLLSTMAKALVDHPEEVVIHAATNTNSGFVAYEVWCREEDAGALLGKRGNNATAIRTLLMAAGAARRIRVSVQIMSNNHDRVPPR